MITTVQGDTKTPFSIATTPRCRRGRYSILRMAPLYPWSLPYSAELTLLLQIIQFSIRTQLISIWPIDRTISSATTPDQSGPGSDGNEEVICIRQSFSITGTSLSDCLVLYPEKSLGARGRTSLQRCSQCILLPKPTGKSFYN